MIKLSKTPACALTFKKRSRVQLFEKYSDYVIAQSDSANYFKTLNPIWLNVLCDTPPSKNYLKKFDSEEIIISHFPSNPKLKQSHIIIPILNELCNEFDNIKLVIKTNTPHNQVLTELERTHILVDRLGASYGVLAVEAMSRGCITIVGQFDYISDNFSHFAPVEVRRANLKDKLISLILNKKLRLKIAKKSLNFYKKYHSQYYTAKYYKENLNL